MITDILSIIVVVITWASFLLFLAVILLFYKSPIYYYEKVCDKCTPSSAKHRYVFRLSLNYDSPSILKSTNLSVDVLRDLASLLKVTFSPTALMKGTPDGSPRAATCRLIVYRMEPLTGITHVVLNHDQNESILVYKLEIQELTELEANIAYVDKQIKSLDGGAAMNTQKFPMARREGRDIESELKPKPYPSLFEVTIIFFLTVNVVFLLNIFLIPCKINFMCYDYENGLFSSVLAGIASSSVTAVLFGILCLSLRNCLKKPLYRSQTAGKKVFRCLFLLVVVALGIVIGSLAATLGANGSKFPATNPGQTLPHEIYWAIADIIAFAVFFLIFVPIMSMIGYCMGFFTYPESNIRDPQTPAKMADDEPPGGANDYYEEVMKANIKVKSVSQYRGLQKKTTLSDQTGAQSKPQPSATGSSAKLNTYGSSKSKSGVPKSSSKSTKKTLTVSSKPGKEPSTSKSAQTGKDTSKNTGSVKKSDSKESVGTAYYHQIMEKQGKVKSVSQY